MLYIDCPQLEAYFEQLYKPCMVDHLGTRDEGQTYAKQTINVYIPRHIKPRKFL